MELLLNGINGNYLRNILLQAAEETHRVDAAVAYATENDLLFDWCWENKLPLRFWGRFDEQVPVSIPILERFLSRKSGRYVCKLVRQFHPKVIWWRGFGAYIGSANLTQSAWWNNVEAGVFLSETELVDGGHDLELEQLFAQIEAHAAPLTQELFDLLSARNKELTRRKLAQKEADEAFNATTLVPHFPGLARTSTKSANEKRRQAFLDEWNSTIQTIRDIAAKISVDANRPSWVGATAPLGAQADQFLHAHYYQNTFDGRRADFESHFTKNRNDPDAAVEITIKWWRKLPDSSAENRMLNKTAPALRRAFSEELLPGLTEDQFVKVLGKVHATREYARRAPNRLIGLKGGQPYDIPEKVDALARHIYRAPTRGGVSALETLSYILYGGRIDDVPQRLWDAIVDPKRKIELIGVSALGEIVGWALPDRFPPRNGRTSKALRSLGYDVTVHVG
ncbi:MULTISPECIES: phospholipase D family protein [Rhizobium/Agrobacterium group]|uniref:phospholipase D family protein n=1 Tax=Rhizobium/Agrobacterium group TaxID=227290 RepID=UPI0015748F84|nr:MULTISPECIES: phospholipase D family protein [Rhizobium/Agrobacterium group]NTC82528.1 phospholipase [Agrobacterium tumefaciens]NTD11351.1 phospholipase [Agrobacterium tumefaciens]NTD85706.1 phospholipase [Agrobacterium tumefaciens]NTD93980.1 phospholipase [Agrobacterium tumefaciens]NTD97130.1 phospholipase [Agrobacterium tumefaciens]